MWKVVDVIPLLDEITLKVQKWWLILGSQHQVCNLLQRPLTGPFLLVFVEKDAPCPGSGVRMAEELWAQPYWNDCFQDDTLGLIDAIKITYTAEDTAQQFASRGGVEISINSPAKQKVE